MPKHAREAASGRFYVCKRYKYFSKLTPSFTGTCSSTESINDFSRKELNLEIIPNWYYLNLYTVETKIVYAEDQGSGTNIIPATSQEIKAGDLWVGLSDSQWKETL